MQINSNGYNEQRYNVNFKQLAVMLLPMALRKPRLINFLFVMVSQISYVARQFDGFRADKNYRLRHTPQVCYLRSVLNDYFDSQLRRIEIEGVAEKQSTIIFKRSLNRFLMVDKRPDSLIINRRGFGGVDGFDFNILIPNDIYNSIDINRLKAIVNTYKLASKRYTITQF